MKKQEQFSNQEIQTEEEIKKVMRREFPLPEGVELAKQNAFVKIRSGQVTQEAGADQTKTQQGIRVVDFEERAKRDERKSEKAAEGKSWKKGIRSRNYFREFAGAAAAVMVVSTVCITNPALAEKIPLVGHVFEALGESLGFSGDFEKYAEPLTEAVKSVDGEEKAEELTGQEALAENTDEGETSEANAEVQEISAAAQTSPYSMTQNGMTVTLSEVYCNDMALYISMVIETEEEFPETVTRDNSDVMLLSIINSTLKFDYNEEEKIVFTELDGRQVDEHTYAGVLRYDMQESADTTDYEEYYEAKKEFFLQQGITEEEYENDHWAAVEKLCEKLGIPREKFSDQAFEEAGGPKFRDYQKIMEIPEKFTVKMTIPQISGTKVDGQSPEMPEDIRAEYEAAMAENGLGLTDEDYAGFTEEQKEIERQLFNKMWNEYAERYPETQEFINPYQDWCVEGPWTFTLDVKKDDSQTIVKEIYDVDENNIGLETVTKTPFEIVVDDSGYVDGFTVVLDADGNPLNVGNTGGSTNILAIKGRDVSKIDVFICDYTEYMDEIKGYPLGDDYEERKRTKTYKQLLEERALYHREIVF